MKAIALAAFALAGCATAGTVPLAGGAGALPIAIAYEVGPCHGFCPVYEANFTAGGSAVFNGQRNTAVSGERFFQPGAAGFRALAQALAPYRPAPGTSAEIGHAQCTLYTTDMPTVVVTWNSTESLRFDYGCHDDRYAPLAKILRAVPETMGLTPFIARPAAS